jgi:hypothetical protein
MTRMTRVTRVTRVTSRFALLTVRWVWCVD